MDRCENQGEERGVGDQSGFARKIEKGCWIKLDLRLSAMVG
jgi:hypothetical protein